MRSKEKEATKAKRMLKLWADNMRREREETDRCKTELMGYTQMDFKYWIGKFLFHFGTVLLAICAAQVLFRCFS